MGAMSDAATSAALFDEVVQLRTERNAAVTTLAECEAQLPTLPGTGGDMAAFSISSRIASIAREAIDGREGERIAFASVRAAKAENTRLKETVEAARAALKPFAERGARLPPEPEDHAPIYVRAGDLRTARSVLATIPPKENP